MEKPLPEIPGDDMLYRCAGYIKANADEDGFFKDSFDLEDKKGTVTHFDVHCLLLFGTGVDGSYCAGAVIFYLSAGIYDVLGRVVRINLPREQLEIMVRE